MRTIKRVVPVMAILLFAMACASGPTEPFEAGSVLAEDEQQENAGVTEDQDLDAARARLLLRRQAR